jgi:hypothetical protein
MRAWTRARRVLLCGGCGATIPRDAPVLEIMIGSLVKVRGACCEGPAPDLIEAPDVRVADRRPPVRLSAMLPLDWRRRSAGDREPGEEG